MISLFDCCGRLPGCLPGFYPGCLSFQRLLPHALPLTFSEISDIPLEGLGLDCQWLPVIESIDSLSIDDLADNLRLEGISLFVLRSLNCSLSGNFAISKVALVSALNILLQLDQALSRDKDVIVSQ